MAHTHTIDCREALAKLYDYIDGELDSADRDAFQAHLEACRPCLSYYEFERFFTEFLRRHTPQPCVREEFKSRLLARLSDERQTLESVAPPRPAVARRGGRFTLLMPRFALAAVIVLAIGLGSYWLGHRSGDGVDWALLTSYHQETAEVEEDGLDTPDFAAARAFVVSRLGPSAEPVLPRRLPAGLACEAACVLPWGDSRVAQFEWRAGSEKISMFLVPLGASSLTGEPEHRPRIVVQDHDYHMMSRDGINALCWKAGPKGLPRRAGAKTHICIMMGSAGFSNILAWAESMRHGDSLSSSNPGAAPGAGIGN
jgi:anti-sigma factor (TIGR02949 family)